MPALSGGSSQDAAQPPTRLRSYQSEMLSHSLAKNVIVAMDTGSGKTHIAIARIRAELERTGEEKLIWFLAPSRTLAEQQYRAITAELQGYGVRLLTGADGVEKWTDQRLWDAVLNNIRAVVATPAVLKDALNHAFIAFSRLSLLIFDEAHHCIKNHPMNAIMQLFYHPARQRGESVPAILGLSASPAMSSSQTSLQRIESNMNALAVTPKHNRIELQAFVHMPQLVTITYKRLQPVRTDPLCIALAKAVQQYDLELDPYIVELRQHDDERSQKKLIKMTLNRKTYCNNQLSALDLRAQGIQEQLGDVMACWYIHTSITRFRDGLSSHQAFLVDLSELERKHLSGLFTKVEQDARDIDVDVDVNGAIDAMSDKACQLVDFLEQNFDKTVRGIVFVEQRVQVTALAELLRQAPALSGRYAIGSFVGTSVSSNRKVSVADLVALNEQQEDLDAFRTGKKNLMIATTVLEEGIDISACNLVICFDLPKNLVSFVQRRGRARRKDSKYVLFISEEDINKGGKPWGMLEAEMKKLYMDDTRELITSPESNPEKSYQVSSTGAVLTMEDAKSHLQHFCEVGVLVSSGQEDLRPEFDSYKNPDTNLWSATVQLPAFVHPDLRRAQSLEKWENEAAAFKDAAFEAYVALHKAGLVNDNLLPLVKDYGPQAGQEHIDQPSLVEVTERKSPFAILSRELECSTIWCSFVVSVVLGGECIIKMNLWLPKGSRFGIEPFELHWNESTSYTIYVESGDGTEISESSPDMNMFRKCTLMMLVSVHGNRMEESKDDFPVLVSPHGINDLQEWIKSIDGHDPPSGLAAGWTTECGLIKVSSQQGRLYFFDHLEQQTDGGEQLVVRSFPKRRDFLHPIHEGSTLSAAHTATTIVPLSECTVERLPAKYALFAVLFPSILHRLDTSLLAWTVSRTVLPEVGFSNTAGLETCFSAPAAGEPQDYNRLEYLGDCVLKHCAELQVMAQHLVWPESYLTVERDRIVRNSNLAKAAIELGLDSYILTQPFTGSKWRPPYISKLRWTAESTRTMSTKTLADVVEALVGAAYEDGGLEKGLLVIKTLLHQETWLGPSQCFDLLIGDLRSTEVSNLSHIEQLVGHKFRQPALLVEAITHVSFANNKNGLSYERLEYLGDSVLDMIVTPKLYAHSRQLKHWELHRYHEALVNSHFLGYCCLTYFVEESQYNVVERSSGELETEQMSRKVYLHDFLRAGSQVTGLKRSCIARFETVNEDIRSQLEKNHDYPWVDLVTLSPPKFFCDLVESILGALYIDTRGDLNVCEEFVRRLGILGYMKHFLDDSVECISPKERMGIVADRDEVRYTNATYEADDGTNACRCTLQVGEEEIVVVEGCRSKDEAEVKAAHQACKILEARNGARQGRKKKFAEMKVNVGAAPMPDETVR